MHIRDPIHGAIEVTPEEQALVDSPQYQRLRNVKQLGFADLAFPGATHTRYAHGLGAMFVATRLFDSLAPELALAEPDRARLRQTLRLSVLFHDLGHAPLSHATEAIMPRAAELNVPAWTQEHPDPARQADHEDYTLKLLLDSGLAFEIGQRMKDFGVRPEHVAALVCGQAPPGPSPFVLGGKDLLPLLRQIVSGELDADRMDYLQRDSFFTGVNYGKFDVDWIVQNLACVEKDGRVHLGLQRRAVFAFEDFLLSRYHMFLGVYLHHASVGYEELLMRYCQTSSGEYALPADIDAYLAHDDVALIAALRRSENPWARRIVRRNGFRLLVERGPNDLMAAGDESGERARRELGELRARLDEAGIDAFVTTSRGVLSKGGKEDHLWVVTPQGEIPIEAYTPLYQRYARPAALVRLYVAPERVADARRVQGEAA